MSAGMIIIGAGETGVRAASVLRLQGYDGPVTLLDTEDHQPYERPPLSKRYLTEDQPVPAAIGGAEALAEKGVTLRTGVIATHIDRAGRKLLTSNGEALEYECLLLATGARARGLSFSNLAPESVLTLRSQTDANRIRSRVKSAMSVVIVGGGFIGLELASSLTRTGLQVTVLEMQSRVLQRAVPAPIAELLLAEHRNHDVDIWLSTGIEMAERLGDGARLTLTDGSILDADLIIAGIGSTPNIELADAAGLVIDNGIAVDAGMRTSDDAIFAAGDCCSFPLRLYGDTRLRLESWRCAQEQGEVAALNMLGRGAVYDQAPWFWSDQYDLGLQIAGIPGFASHTVLRAVGERAMLLFHLGEDGRLLAASGIAPGNSIAKDIKIAERLINRQARPDPQLLADPGFNLKSLLKP